MEKKKKKKKHKKKNKNTVAPVKGIEVDSKFSLFEVVIIILISVIFGVIIGYLITYSNSNLRRVRSNSHLGEVVSTYNNIVDNYYEDLDEDVLAESAIKGMIASLNDPYSSFLDKNSTSNFNESVDGEYVGIGITVEFKEDYNVIISLLKDGSGEKAGLQVGDIILMIDGKDCKGIYSGELSQMITGKVGSTVKLTIEREGERKTISVVRQVIEIENVSYELLDNKIGYIHIKVFSSNSYDQFKKALTTLEEKKIQSLIIDVRDNPGGQLVQAKSILSMFFSKKTLLYQTESNGVREKIYSTSNEVRNYPIIVLVNGETASSAEVLASCFQENYSNVQLVGTNTYGKSNVQKSLTLHNGTSIKFTIQTWLTSKGKIIGEEGIIPDVFLEQDPRYYVEDDVEDAQLQKAISLLK